jgi:hypothetical protein
MVLIDIRGHVSLIGGKKKMIGNILFFRKLSHCYVFHW